MAGYKNFILPLLLLAGCVSGAMTPYQAYKAGKPFPMFYKAGVGFAQIENDNTNCKIDANYKCKNTLGKPSLCFICGNSIF